jgi:hypothetical protein
VTRIASVRAVAPGRVCERVARVKSSKRRRRTTVRPTRLAFRMRSVTRSTRPMRTVSSSSADLRRRPSARCEPIDPRRRLAWTGRGSLLWASAWRCRPEARPSMETRAVSSSSATWPTVSIPTLRSFRPVAGPTPQRRSTGRGWRNSSSLPGGTRRRPSGFATPLATLARNFVRATPTVTGMPTRSRTSRRRRSAISLGVPAIRRIPRTSRKASSMDRPSTRGVASSKTW